MEGKSKQVLVFAGIALSLALIFGSGVWVGRLTAPEGLTLEELEGYYAEEQGRIRKDGEAAGPGLAGLPRLEALQRYHRTLRFKPEQRRAVYPYFAEASRMIRALPENTKENRLPIVEELHQKMRPHLDEDQKRLANEILDRAKKTENDGAH